MSEAREYHNPINKEFTKILKTSAETNGEYSLLEVSLSCGGINPMHFHYKFTEEFEAVEGDLHLTANSQKVVLRPGEKLAVLPLVKHQFHNPSKTESIVFRVKLSPGQPDFENFIKAAFGLINDGKTWKNQVPKSILEAAVILNWGDTHFTNYIFRIGTPFMKKMYKIAVKKGIDKKLKATYCESLF